MKSSEVKYNGYTIEIHADENALDPRKEFDNLGTMVCYHRRYDLGDKHGHGNQDSFKEFLKQNKDQIVQLPLYLYDHSGITMNTTGFGHVDAGGWDSGMVGIIYITKEKARKEYGWRVITAARIKKLKEYLQGEVKLYDQYLTGEVYGYVIKDSTGEEIDSCWGYYGFDHEESSLLSSARNAVDAQIGTKLKAHLSKLKSLIKSKAPLRVRPAAPACVGAEVIEFFALTK